MSEQLGTSIQELRSTIDGLPVAWHQALATGTPTLFVHGVPTSSDIWLPFLARAGGVAPDLPGFGRSGKPADYDYSIAGFDRFIEAFLSHLGIERIRLVVQDWGGAALAFAQRFPERIERLVIIDAVPLLPGYRWHRVARAWRTRLLGEIVMGMTAQWSMRLTLREASGTRSPLPEDFVRSIWRHFDHGTQRAILRLYRGAPEPALAQAGAHLGGITAPALVLWGERDPYVPVRFADAYAERLPNATLRRVPGAGHWPWLDRPELIDDVCAFLAGAQAGMGAPGPESE